MKGLDFIDTMSVFLFVGSVTTIPPLGVVAGVFLVLLYFARRNEEFQTMLLGEDTERNNITNWLLPPPKQLSAPKMTESENTKPILTPVFSSPQNDPFAMSTENDKLTLKQAITKLPQSVNLREYRIHESKTAVPLGDDGDSMQWIDLSVGSEISALHIGLYGITGCGKDNWLRVMFALLCKRNSPNDIQFAVIDGKGDWLVPWMANLKHMFIAPAGGYGMPGESAIRTAIQQIDREAVRRQQCITNAGVRTREQYVEVTGKPMPLLVVIATDVMVDITAPDIEKLLVRLVSKARSLGIRVIVSMQTSTQRDTRWRMNLSTKITGSLEAGSQDNPALGIPVDDMVHRPSELPNKPGLFIVVRNKEQLLVQSPYIRESEFDRICQTLPMKSNTSDGAVLSKLLNSTIQQDSTDKSEFTIPFDSTAQMPDRANSRNIKVLLEIKNRLQQGQSKTRIVREMWGVEGGKMFNLYGSIVDKVKRSM